jgi:hypothetical protein
VKRSTAEVRSSRRPGVRRLAVLAILVAGVLGGCTARTAPLEIAVREIDSRRPIAGLDIRLAGADLVDPRSGTALDSARSGGVDVLTGGDASARSGFTTVTGRTDAFGLLVLRAPVDAPFEILVLRAGDPVRRVMLGGHEHPAVQGRAGDWIALDGSGDAATGDGDGGRGRTSDQRLELQVRPTPY